MTEFLSGYVVVKPRFARSANVERDDFLSAIDGYVPTARALDVVTRVVAGLQGANAERAISVTGPYGSGKSSLALFLSALFGPAGNARDEATDLLRACDSELADRLVSSRSSTGERGFVVCAVVAQREPVTATLLRALRIGVLRYSGDDSHARKVTAFAAVLDAGGAVAASTIRLMIDGVAGVAPVLLILDEFGKNLEQFVATGGAEDDLFVLQDIAEWAASSTVNPIMLLTLQHLAFEDYAAGASAAKRREWSKVQGRFADVPYVESPAQSQALITSVFERSIDLSKWATQMRKTLEEAGIADQLFVDVEDIYPLHPITAAVLPELCSRYGQNERTLFSFLAGPDPGAVPSFLASQPASTKGQPRTVDLDHVYDFFLESASTMVSASASASRWLEIETRIRDAMGLTPEELRLLKSVAVMNLVSSGGSLRSNRAILESIFVRKGFSSGDVGAALAGLEAKGLVTFRAFADEYRIWSGSDFDLKGAVELARRRLADEPVAAILERVRPQAPVVAARHSQTTGTLRVFERRFVDAEMPPVLEESQKYDGVVLLDISMGSAFSPASHLLYSRPVVIGRTNDATAVVKAGRELAAHLDVLDGPEGRAADWVARRELTERAASAASTLDQTLERAFGSGATGPRWEIVGRAAPRRQTRSNLSAQLSKLCDERYPDAPILRNEMLSRRDLTSQGARARRELLQAMVSNPSVERCGIEGYGPERAMYEAILARPQIHRRGGDAMYLFGEPFENSGNSNDLNFAPAWNAIVEMFDTAEDVIVPLDKLYERLMAPPIGLKEGPIPVLVVAALLAHAQTVALYENGSFVTRLDAPVIERLIRNPDLFSIKSYATQGARADLVRRLSQELGVVVSPSKGARVTSIVSLVGPLLGRARSLPIFTQRTKRLSKRTAAVRAALFNATEPDVLIFERLPEAVEVGSFPPRLEVLTARVDQYIERLKEALDELSQAFPVLLDHIEAEVQRGLAARGDDVRITIAGRVSQFADVILDPELKSFVFALSDSLLDRDEWLQYIGMVITSKAPGAWTDEDASRFDLKAAELASAIRRIEGLYYEQSEPPGEGFRAVRVSLTTPDGTDRPRVVWVDESVRAHLEAVTAEALTRVEQLLGPGGREMLLATLALELLGDAKGDSEVLNTSSTAIRRVGA